MQNSEYQKQPRIASPEKRHIFGMTSEAVTSPKPPKAQKTELKHNHLLLGRDFSAVPPPPTLPTMHGLGVTQHMLPVTPMQPSHQSYVPMLTNTPRKPFSPMHSDMGLGSLSMPPPPRGNVCRPKNYAQIQREENARKQASSDQTMFNSLLKVEHVAISPQTTTSLNDVTLYVQSLVPPLYTFV